MATAARRLLVRRGPTAPGPPLRSLERRRRPPARRSPLRLRDLPLLPRRAQRRALHGTTIALTEVNPLTKAEIKFSETPFEKVSRSRCLMMGRSWSRVGRPGWTNSSGGRHLRKDFASPAAHVGTAWATNELAPMVYPNLEDARRVPPGPRLRRRRLRFCGCIPRSSNVGALGMSLAHGKIKAKYNIDDERAALFEKLALHVGNRAWATGRSAAATSPYLLHASHSVPRHAPWGRLWVTVTCP